MAIDFLIIIDSTSLHRQMQSIRIILVSLYLAPKAGMNHLTTRLHDNLLHWRIKKKSKKQSGKQKLEK